MCVRDRVSRLPGVEIIANVEVTGLLATQDNMSVIGLRVREREKDSHTNTLFADLVVDASGRHSQAPEWLVKLGYQVETELPTSTLSGSCACLTQLR